MAKHVPNNAVMSATADSSCGELSDALQRNAKHEAGPSNVSDCCRKESIQKCPEIQSLASPETLSGLCCSFASLRMTMAGGL